MPDQRFEMYRPIHKAIRHLLYSTAHQLGMADFADEGIARESLDELDGTISMMKEHPDHEERFVHPPLESRVPGITKPFDQDHGEDEKVYAQLEQLGAQIRGSGEDQRSALGNRIYSVFNSFIGSYLPHLDREETVLEKALLDNFTDEELVAIDQQIIGSVPPERMGVWLGVICASLNADELTGMFGGMKATAPPEAVEGMLKLAEQAMPADTFQKVLARIS